MKIVQKQKLLHFDTNHGFERNFHRFARFSFQVSIMLESIGYQILMYIIYYYVVPLKLALPFHPPHQLASICSLFQDPSHMHVRFRLNRPPSTSAGTIARGH